MNARDIVPKYTVSNSTADTLRRKLHKAAAEAKVGHIIVQTDNGKIIGVLATVEEFNALLKAAELLQTPGAMAELKVDSDRSSANTMKFEEVFD